MTRSNFKGRDLRFNHRLSIYNTNVLENLSNTLIHECGLNPTLPVLLGLSGGADSICLMHIFLQLGYKTIAAHYDHSIRPDSTEDAVKVQEICKQAGTSFTMGQGDVPGYAKSNGLSIEEAARVLRYRFLFKQAKIQNAQAVAVAHHADDQVETILMNLVRGAGIDGLQGMAHRVEHTLWSNSMPLIRPLLSVWKHEIDTYCSERALDIILDESNQDTSFFRNQIRHDLIPRLDQMIPKFRQRIWQMGNLLRTDNLALNEYVDHVWDQVVVVQHERSISFDQYLFDQQPLGVQRRLVRRAVSQIRSDPRDIDYALVDRCLGFIAKPTQTGKVDIGLGLKCIQGSNKYILSTWDHDELNNEWPKVVVDRWVAIPGEYVLENGWLLRVEECQDMLKSLELARQNNDPFCAWLDVGETIIGFYVRKRVTGERFRPLGMGGRGMKLSDFMINKKIPKPARKNWPLIAIRDEVVWVPGYQLSDLCRLTSESTRVIRVSLERINPA